MCSPGNCHCSRVASGNVHSNILGTALVCVCVHVHFYSKCGCQITWPSFPIKMCNVPKEVVEFSYLAVWRLDKELENHTLRKNMSLAKENARAGILTLLR